MCSVTNAPAPIRQSSADHDSVHQHGTHADQDAIVNRTAMQHDVVTDRDIVADNQGIRVVSHVEKREILDVGAPADPNEIDVATDHTVKPHAGFRFDDHVADDHRSIFDEDGMPRWSG